MLSWLNQPHLIVDTHGASGGQPLPVYSSINDGEPAIIDMLLLSIGTVPGHGMSMCKIKQSTFRTYH